MQVVAAEPGGGEEDASGDAIVDHVLTDVALFVENPRAQQRLRGLTAPGVTGGGNATAIDAAGEPWDGGLDGIELVQDASEVSDPLGPDGREHRVLEPEAIPA